MTKIQSASGGSNVLDIEYWNLEFICYLGIVIWCFSSCLPAIALKGCLEISIFKDASIQKFSLPEEFPGARNSVPAKK
jgi:hypothetical protein